MRLSTYKKPIEKERWGWMATMPFPRRLTAEMIAEDLSGKYEDVRVEETTSGDFIVKYRAPRKR